MAEIVESSGTFLTNAVANISVVSLGNSVVFTSGSEVSGFIMEAIYASLIFAVEAEKLISPPLSTAATIKPAIIRTTITTAIRQPFFLFFTTGGGCPYGC